MFWSDLKRLSSWCTAAKISLAVALHLIVASCQPLPQPFAYPEKAINPIVVPPTDFAGITILPIPDLPESMARSLSTAMAEELLTHEIIASPDSSNQRSRFLQGAVTQMEAGNARTRVTVIWDLFDGNGKFLGSKQATRTFPRDAWLNGGERMLRPLVKAAAADVASLVKGGNDQLNNKSSITLHIWPVEGVPDKKARPLKRAMRLALRKLDFRIADALDGAGLVIAGTIELGPEDVEPRPIRITWAVLDTAGTELGKLTQQNAVPRVVLEKGWNTLAATIADNAAGGVGNLIVRLPRSLLRSTEKRAK